MISATSQQQKNRQFICPCTKAYYSYAALFTHIKQKHNGKAPGQIIKPKPQNKRGRPRKSIVCASPQRGWKDNGGIHHGKYGLMTNTINLNHVNINTKIIQSSSPLKSTPGSQFKYYKADSTQIPTTNELPNQMNPPMKYPLLQHLTSNLTRIQSHPLPILQQIESYKFFTQIKEGRRSQIIQCLSQFIQFCGLTLKEQIVRQIELLMIILLQHVYQLRNRSSFQGVKHIVLNDYIDSFFQRMEIYIKRWSLQDQPIFQGLNPMKILVVYYNWINNLHIHEHIEEEESEHVEVEVSDSPSNEDESQQ